MGISGEGVSGRGGELQKDTSRRLTGYLRNSKAVSRGALKALIRTLTLTLDDMVHRSRSG